MDHHSGSELERLDHVGIKIDVQGRITDWADRPSYQGRPMYQDDRGRRKEYTAQQELQLREWCTAAEQEGMLRGSSVFEELESLRPSHSWLSYEGKWRKKYSAQPRVQLEFTTIYPNLSGSSDTSTRNPASAAADPPCNEIAHTDHEERTSTGSTTTYTDFRVDIARSLFTNVGVADEEEFRELLQDTWFVSAYDEFARWSLSPQLEDGLTHLSASDRVPQSAKSKAPHTWKIVRTCSVLRDPCGSKYLSYNPDRSTWVEDDHDIRFMAMATKNALVYRSTSHGMADGELECICRKTLWLMLWLRWLYRVSKGQAREVVRLQARKEMWRKYLAGLTVRSSPSASTPGCSLARGVDEETLVVPMPSPSPPSKSRDRPFPTTQPQVENVTLGQQALSDSGTTPAGHRSFQAPPPSPHPSTSQITSRDPMHDGQSRSQSKARKLGWLSSATTSKIPAAGGLAIPQYHVTQSRTKDQQRGVFWLTQEARVAYQNHRDWRINSWGVGSEHVGTCVLVHPHWAHIAPGELTESFVWDPQTHDESSRLQLNLGDLSTSWGRAAVWFETWPRRGVDLDAILLSGSGPWPEMHGSHLCHQGHCILPRHITLEEKQTNLDRIRCATAARNLRSYGARIPKHCRQHDPPCFMQHASLTPLEAVLVQLHVLRLANGVVEPVEPSPCPPDHLDKHPTFETKIPLSFEADAVCVASSDLLGKDRRKVISTRLEPFSLRCPFCMGAQRSFRHITAFWSHVRHVHVEIDVRERLGAVARSAKDYMAWIEARSFNYAQSNEATWAKLCQAQASGFDWETFEGWRLPLAANAT